MLLGLLVMLTGAVASNSFAVLPPDAYCKAVEESLIKALARVDRVKTIRNGWHHSTQRTTFTLIKPYFGTKVTQHFSATSLAVLWPWQKPDVGGQLFYYPKKGESVFVTISKDGGAITSYTVVTEAIEDALENKPKKINFGLSSTCVEEPL